MAKFADLARALKSISLIPSQVATGASKGIAEQIDAQFDAGVDPYGEPWAPLADATIERGRFPPPLTDDGDLRRSVEVKPLPGAGISVTFDDPGVHHQYGYRNARTGGMVPARPIFPNKGMPDTWKREISDAAEEAFDRIRGELK